MDPNPTPNNIHHPNPHTPAESATQHSQQPQPSGISDQAAIQLDNAHQDARQNAHQDARQSSPSGRMAPTQQSTTAKNIDIIDLDEPN